MKNIFKEREDWYEVYKKYDNHPIKEFFFHPVNRWSCPPIINALCVVSKIILILCILGIIVSCIISICALQEKYLIAALAFVALAMIFAVFTIQLKYYDV